MPRPTRRSAPRPRSWCEDSVSYRLEIATAMLLAGAIGVGLWAANRSPKPPERDFRSSTYLTGPSGSKGLHEILVALGRPSERRRVSLKTLATERAHRPAILVLLDPIFDLDNEELGQVVRYVRAGGAVRSEEHTSELQSLRHLVCRLLLEKKKERIVQKLE